MSEASKGFIAGNWFKLFIVTVVVILLAIYFYRENKLDVCLDNTNEIASRLWDEKCSADKKGPRCDLNPFIANDINKMREAQIDQCFRRYSLK